MRPTRPRRLPHKAIALPIALAVISAAVVTLALARGGAHEPTAGRLDPPFLQKVDRLCAKEAPALRSTRRAYPGLDAGHPRATELPAVGAYFAPRATVLLEIANALRGLGEPASARTEWDHTRYLVARYAEVAARQVAVARAADVSGFVATVNEISVLRDELIDSASALGFTLASPCARSL
jgi:hypothetical protein